MRSRFALLVVVGACANDPEYLPAAATLEGGTMMDAMGNLIPAKGSVVLPIKPESQKDMDARAALQATLDPAIVVPYVKVDDVAISVDWTVTNLDMDPGQFEIEVNGANEAFTYDPTAIPPPANDDEAPPSPGLSGDIPTDIAAGATISGEFTEETMLEATVDLDEITRGNIPPYGATLTISKNAPSFQPVMIPAPTQDNPDPAPVPVGPAIPRLAFRGMIRVDLVFKPNKHMTLDFNVRVRDRRGIIDDKGVQSPASELWDMVVQCADLANACPTIYKPPAAM
jgi:hypothetical protein